MEIHIFNACARPMCRSSPGKSWCRKFFIIAEVHLFDVMPLHHSTAQSTFSLQCPTTKNNACILLTDIAICLSLLHSK